MTWESEPTREGRDRAKLVWGGIMLLLVFMGLAMWLGQGKVGGRTRVHAKHILISFDRTDPADRTRALETITELRQRIVDGESLSRIAKNFSNDPGSASRGGDLGWLKRDSLTEAIEDYVWHAPIGELSDVIQTGFGFHLVIVIDRQFSEADRYERALRQRVFESPKRSEESAKPESSP